MDSFSILTARIPDLDIEEARETNEEYIGFSDEFLKSMKNTKSEFENARGTKIKYKFLEPVVGEFLPFMYPYFEEDNAFVFIPSFYADDYEKWKNDPNLDKRIYCETIKNYASIHESIEICVLDTKQKEKSHKYSCLLSYLHLNNSKKIKSHEYQSPDFQIPFLNSLINKDIQYIVNENNISPLLGVAYTVHILEENRIDIDGSFESIVRSL